MTTVADILRARKRPPMTRAERRRMAPKPPRAAAMALYTAIDGVIGDIEARTKAIIFPMLPQVVAAHQGAVAKPPPLANNVHAARIKHDNAPAPVCGVCGEGAPNWYLDYMYVTTYQRMDALSGEAAVRLGVLEVAIKDATSERVLIPILQEIAAEVFRHNTAEMSRVLSLDLRARGVGLSGFIQDFIQTNVQLIQSVGADQLGRMTDVISNSTAGQIRVEDLAASLEDTFGLSRSRAALIARDQTLKANADLSQLRQQQVGISEYIWTSSGDEKVRGRPDGKYPKSQSDHWILDGTIQSWLNPPVTNQTKGARNHPGKDYQCRCTATPRTDALLDGPPDE